MDTRDVFLWEKNMSSCWRRIYVVLLERNTCLLVREEYVFLLDKNRCCLVGGEYMAMEDDFLRGAHCSCAKKCAMVVTG